jgi:hypothetical protein
MVVKMKYGNCGLSVLNDDGRIRKSWIKMEHVCFPCQVNDFGSNDDKFHKDTSVLTTYRVNITLK